ncbi:MAG: LD-carboxypeptidase [Deltaproteobacteria bacterium]|nr:LD-carboxypeptidase [Deltaproteobacteria bacterium]
MQPKDRIRIIAPSGPVDKQVLQQSSTLIQYPYLLGKDVFHRDGFWAGTVEHRSQALQEALDDDNCAAILCARGGFGMSPLLDTLDFKKFAAAPKWIIGNSDITALLVHVWAYHRIMSIHGPMAQSLSQYPPTDINDMHLLLGKGNHPRQCALETISQGDATGPLIGGNLTMLAHMIGTLPDSFARDCILFMEDVGETPYRIERCLVQLSRCGVLSRARGIVLGEFTNCSPGPDGVSVNTVLHRNLEHLGIPVATGYPGAHGKRNRPFIHGQLARLSSTEKNSILED